MFRSDDELEALRQLIRLPNGIVIVTGPTGSGKTTTLYSALSELNEVHTKILTVEDPVEYDIDGLVQVQINSRGGPDVCVRVAQLLKAGPRHYLGRRNP